jgi:Uma2 family endonuclease
MPGLTVKDLEKLQLLHPDYRMELVGGEIIVMSPFEHQSDEAQIEFCSGMAESSLKASN